jgi:ribonuclease HII
MSQNKPTKEELLKRFEQWVNQYREHHPEWAKGTRDTYITDAKRILRTNDCLPGGGYPAVWDHIIRLVPEAESEFGDSVREHFQKKKNNCPPQRD